MKEEFVPLKGKARENEFVRRAVAISELSAEELKKHGDLSGNRKLMFVDYFSHEYPNNILLRVCLIVVYWKLFGTGQSNDGAKTHIKYLNRLESDDSEKALEHLSKKKAELEREASNSAA